MRRGPLPRAASPPRTPSSEHDRLTRRRRHRAVPQRGSRRRQGRRRPAGARPRHARVYVYDNCSTDRTAERGVRGRRVVRCEPLKGKGNVVRRAFADIDADIYLLIDGDDTYDAARRPANDRAARRRDPRPRASASARRSRAADGTAYRPGHATGNKVLNRIVARHLRRQHGRHAQRLPGLLAPLREELPRRLARVRDRDRADRALRSPCASRRPTVPVDFRDRAEGSESQAAHLPRRLQDPRLS